ncbi:hypothetical protein GA0061078_1387 [Bifidobacterium bohemicum]|uniref:CTP synthase n=1 Tax=Bifidobacterium bohemicum DSM 22767 TaxID=1437606 RepID=A0A086ZGS8_9BIFI|nr:hypothetical protein [Bifidobacterium bohemicum]KFI45728.1 hypothetical protein BBOH_0529 [Bifidobacterium bohemicum DSM 22767]SCC08089.1 hypothetical protein GA0061078_1387 [Bifidobacterium bohemicum]
MRRNPSIDRLADEAERERRYFFGKTNAQRHAMRRRRDAGELMSPYKGIYARKNYSATLDPRTRTMHLIRALGKLHPGWSFAGLSAANIHGLPYRQSLDDDTTVCIATRHSTNQRHADGLTLIHMTDIPVTTCAGLLTTTVERTLIDCALRHSFIDVLGMFDFVLSMGLTTAEGVKEQCATLQKSKADTVINVLHYANPLSENGGESMCRAVIIEAGFVLPELQQEFRDPRDGDKLYRVDFLWRLPDRRLVVLEYDGMEKYRNPKMTGWRGTRAVVTDERARENALRRAGISEIIRTDFQEVINRQPLVDKLATAGIPPAASLRN